jgi:hypothetical protein
LRERLAARKGHIVALFCDEAQRQSRNSYEWLRDVHDQLAYHGIRLITFLIGQPQLLARGWVAQRTYCLTCEVAEHPSRSCARGLAPELIECSAAVSLFFGGCFDGARRFRS